MAVTALVKGVVFLVGSACLLAVLSADVSFPRQGLAGQPKNSTVHKQSRCLVKLRIATR